MAGTLADPESMSEIKTRVWLKSKMSFQRLFALDLSSGIYGHLTSSGLGIHRVWLSILPGVK